MPNQQGWRAGIARRAGRRGYPRDGRADAALLYVPFDDTAGLAAPARCCR